MKSFWDKNEQRTSTFEEKKYCDFWNSCNNKALKKQISEQRELKFYYFGKWYWLLQLIPTISVCDACGALVICQKMMKSLFSQHMLSDRHWWKLLQSHLIKGRKMWRSLCVSWAHTHTAAIRSRIWWLPPCQDLLTSQLWVSWPKGCGHWESSSGGLVFFCSCRQDMVLERCSILLPSP